MEKSNIGLRKPDFEILGRNVLSEALDLVATDAQVLVSINGNTVSLTMDGVIGQEVFLKRIG